MKCTWWRRLDLFLFPPGFCTWRSHKKQDSFIELTLEKECSLWEYSAFTNALPLISWCWVLSIISINAFFSWPQIRTFVCPKHFEQIKICQIVLIILRLVTQVLQFFTRWGLLGRKVWQNRWCDWFDLDDDPLQYFLQQDIWGCPPS